VVRTYRVKIAVPSNRPHSWEVNPGDDYKLLITTRGFTRDARGVKIDGRIKCNYQVQLDDNKGPIGPNPYGFAAQVAGQPTVVQVLNSEAAGRIYREFDETEIEKVVSMPDYVLTVGVDESEDAQERRWSDWTSILKRGLR